MIDSLTVERVVRLLENQRFTAGTEEGLQRGIQMLLDAIFPGAFEREYNGFGRRDRPDFYCASAGIVLEVKNTTAGGTAPKVFAQLGRYAENQAVRHLILATPSRRIASLVGDNVGGKPISRVILRTAY